MSIIGTVIPSTAADLRRAGVVRALRAVHDAGGELSRAQLARDLDCTRATAAALVGDLAGLGLLTERPPAPTGRRGRPTPRVMPAREGPAVAVVEIGVDAIRVATSTIGGAVSAIETTAFRESSVETVTTTARAALARRLGTLGRRCVGVGVGVFGLVDRASGQVVEAPNLGWAGVDVLARLDVPERLPARMDNVANLIALADSARGAGRGHRTVLHLHAGIGVGGALVVDGRALLGRSGLAGEYGHLPFGTSGRDCRCGARGCWETEVDQLALARAASSDAGVAAAAGRTAGRVLAAAAAGERAARAAVEEVGAALGRGIGALVNVHDPDLVVLAGHAAEVYAAVPAVVDRAAQAAALAAHRGRMPAIRPTPLLDAPLVGAAELLFADLLQDPWSLVGVR